MYIKTIILFPVLEHHLKTYGRTLQIAPVPAVSRQSGCQFSFIQQRRSRKLLCYELFANKWREFYNVWKQYFIEHAHTPRASLRQANTSFLFFKTSRELMYFMPHECWAESLLSSSASQLVKLFPAYYTTQKFITPFTTATQLPCPKPHQSSPSCLIYLLSIVRLWTEL
jgi:hypothetical protein